MPVMVLHRQFVDFVQIIFPQDPLMCLGNGLFLMLGHINHPMSLWKSKASVVIYMTVKLTLL